MTTLRFEFSADYPVTPLKLWSYLSDPVSLSQFSPAITHYEALPTENSYQLWVRPLPQIAPLPVVVSWCDLQPPSRWRWVGTAQWETISAELQASFDLEGEAQTTLHFSAELLLTPPKPPIPISLIHATIRQFLQTFFRRLHQACLTPPSFSDRPAPFPLGAR